MWTFVLECRPNVDLFEQKGPHVDLWRKMWTYLATLQGVNWREVHRPIMDLQNQRLTSQIRDCHREETSYFELF